MYITVRNLMGQNNPLEGIRIYINRNIRNNLYANIFQNYYIKLHSN